MCAPIVFKEGHEPQVSYGEKLIAKTCIKCGAPLRSNKCEYCGTEYGNEKEKLESDMVRYALDY